MQNPAAKHGMPSHAKFSETVGLIYDAAIDVGLWPDAMRSICAHFNSTIGSINVVDLTTFQLSTAVQIGLDQHWIDLLNQKYFALNPFQKGMARAPVDFPHNTELMLELLDPEDRATAMDSPFFREWARPAGLCDNIATIVWREPTRLAWFAVFSTLDYGPLAEHELELASLFAPHVKRSILISDLLGLKSTGAADFETRLAAIGHAAVVVNSKARIVYQNPLAKKMMADGDAIRSVAGVMEPASMHAKSALMRLLDQVQQDESAIGHGGIGIPLPGGKRPAIAYVMPLAKRAALHGWNTESEAVVLIKTDMAGTPTAPENLSALFGLTPAEARAAIEICAHDSRQQAADNLGITLHTLKTHMTRILDKTQTADKAALAILLERLSAPR